MTLIYITLDIKKLEIPSSQHPFQILFNPVKGINTGTCYRTIHPQNITLSIQDVFITYMQTLIEFNENQDTHFYLPSQLKDLKHKSVYFDVPDLETKVQRHDNPHYWLQQDIVQIKNFQYRFFNNIILTDDTIPQVKVFTHFLLKFFRFNYQLVWEQQDQQAYTNFPQILTPTEFLPYIIKNEHKHLQYRNPTSFNIQHFDQINLDHNFITDFSETSDNRPYITTNISPETSSEEQISNVFTQYSRQNTLQQEQDDIINLFQTCEPPQLNPLYPQIPQVPDLQQINTSETATIQNTSELSDETEQIEQNVQNPQSLTITNDSNLLQIPTHNITPEETNIQHQDTTSNTTQDNTSVLSTFHTNITQQSQTLASPRQNYDPPSFPSQFATSNNTHDSPQPDSSYTQHTHTAHFQTPTPPSPPQIQTSTYTPAQNNPKQNVQTGSNINTIHSNPSFNYTTARNLSKPPLQPILTNLLSYSLTSTNSNHTQPSTTNNNTINSLNNTSPPSQTSNTLPPTLQNSQFQIPNPASTTIRTNPYFHNTSTNSFTNISNVPTYNTVQPSTITQNTTPQPTYINSSTSISKLIKPFDGLD